jgi:outer membrane protein assembly factor BamA
MKGFPKWPAISRLLFFCLVYLFTDIISAQKKITVIFEYNNASSETLSQKQDSSLIYKLLTNEINKLISKGYITARKDTMYCKYDTCHVEIYKGNQYKIGTIDFTQEQLSILESTGLKRDKLHGNQIDSTTLYGYLQEIVSHFANHGHPFASARFDSARFEGDFLMASMMVNKGRLITFDTILNEGRLVLNSNFEKRFLDVYPNHLYVHEKLLRAGQRLGDLQYAQQRVAPYVRFVNDRASVVLTLDPKPASRFDFLIGLLPKSNADGSRALTFAVDFTAELNNSFNLGEYSFLQLKRLKPDNLELQVKSTIPYIFGLPVGSHVDFRIFKNATQNLDLYFDGGIQYLFGGYNQMKFFLAHRSSSLLDVNIAQIIATGRLPQKLDVSYTGIGAALNLRKLDYRFNPTRGYAGDISIVAGYKKIQPNRQIIDIPEFLQSYDTLSGKTAQAEIDASFSYFVPIQTWATIKAGVTSGLRYNEKRLLSNELMRIGGSKILRGFDEESISTDFYIFGTTEFRIILDKNSFLSLPFVDYGVTSIVMDGKKKLDPVLGIGMGMNFGTSAGLFNLSIAAGKNLGNALDFGKMKIHFGYINLF